MDNVKLRENLTSLFTNQWKLNEPIYGEDEFTGQYIAEQAMFEEYHLMGAVLNQFFPGITYKAKDQYGGEGQGDEYWTVVEFSSGDVTQLVRFEGYYQSHYGTDYQDWNFVKGVPVMVMKYEQD